MEFIIFIHVLGAIAVGFYLLLPFLAARIHELSAAAQEGYINGLFVSNRISQYILIAQFLTGGYLISQKDYTVWWIVGVIVIFLLMAALAGIMGKPMKRAMENIRNGKPSVGNVGKIKMFSSIIAISMLILIVLMSFPVYR